MPVRIARPDRVAVAAASLIAVALAVRTALAVGGSFYWDDLILIGRAGTQPLLSSGYLFDDHDGHLMPAAFLLAGVVNGVAPLNWAGPAVALVALTLLAWLALLRALHAVLGWRPALLVPLAFALFTPLALPAFAWWAAALNSLPMLAATAWFFADALALVRTGRRRHLVSAAAGFGAALLFFEKSAVIPFVGFALVVLVCHVGGPPGATLRSAVADTWRRGRPLWWASLAVVAGWVAIYVAVVDQRRWSTDLPMTAELLVRSVTHGIVPGLVGGPWQWQRWAPASPWAVPPTAAMALGWAAVTAALVWSLRRRRRVGWVWLVVAGYAVACQVPIYLMRSSAFTALELAQTLRYLSDLVVVAALGMAIGLTAPRRAGRPGEPCRADRPGGRRAVALTTAAVAAITASSLYSTATFLTSWRDNPTAAYLQEAQRSLAEARRTSDAALLDQEVDPLVLTRVAYPENLTSHLFATAPERPAFGGATTQLRMLDRDGRLLDAVVTWVRATLPGPVPGCGHLLAPRRPVTMRLDGPLLPADWTAEINYLANSEGSMTMSLTDGTATRVPVRPGLNRVFVRLVGSGEAIAVEANTAALSVCLAAGPVGFLAPAR